MTASRQCYDCGKTADHRGYTVRCVTCRQSVDHHHAHLVKTNHGSGRGWRCNPCGLIADEWIQAANAQSEVSR